MHVANGYWKPVWVKVTYNGKCVTSQKSNTMASGEVKAFKAKIAASYGKSKAAWKDYHASLQS